MQVTMSVKYVQFGGTKDDAIANGHSFLPAALVDSVWETYIINGTGTQLSDKSNHTADYAAIEVTITVGAISGLLDTAARYKITLTTTVGNDADDGKQAAVTDFEWKLNDAASANLTSATQVLKNDIQESASEQVFTLLIWLDGAVVDNNNIALGSTTFNVAFDKVTPAQP